MARACVHGSDPGCRAQVPGPEEPPILDADDVVARTGWRRLLIEPARPASIRVRPNAHWFTVGAVCVGACMGQLDASIVTVALPALERNFHASLGAVTWVGLTYMLVLVAFVTAVGRFADMLGRKLLYTYGFLVFIVGSALCGLAPDLVALNAFRVLQAAGAAMLQANSVAIIYLVMPREQLGRGIGIQGAAQALGLALGPTIGGLLIALGGWRLIFFVNVPVGVLGTVLAWFLVPRSRHLQARVAFDWAGLAIFVPTVICLLAAISFGDDAGWVSAPILSLFVVAIALGCAFVWWERRVSAPMLDLSLFRRIPFSAGISSGLLSYLALFGVLFVVPFYLDRALRVGVGRAGLELTVMPVALGVVAPLAGRWADRVGARPLTVAGMGIAALAFGALAVWHRDVWVFLVELAALGAGIGMFTPPNNAAIMSAAPPEESGVAAGVLNMTRGMGTAMGLAFTSLVFGLAVDGHLENRQLVTHGFVLTAAFLAAVSLVAMVLAALRGRAPGGAQPL
ncbi:MAG: DHA2 family efflux MFS transporter permease subunit [Solirubrobacteraceae bacterium]